MNYEIDSEKAQSIKEMFNELKGFMTERISDLHQVKGGQQARHAYIFYRELIQEIEGAIFEGYVPRKDDDISETPYGIDYPDADR